MYCKCTILFLIIAHIQFYSQIKVGSNSKSINANTYFEVESTLGQKVIITKDSARLGLGVTNPTNLLHIYTSQNPLRLEGLIKGDSTEGILTVNDSGIIRKVSSLNVGAAYEPWYNSATNRGATLNTQNIYQMGRVGIGNSSPSAPLVVQGVVGNGVLKLVAPSIAAGDNWWMGFGHGTTSTDANDRARIGVDILAGGSGRLFFTTGAAGSQTRAMFIDESQRVGIGTNAPSNKLHVVGNALFTPRSSNDGLGGEPVSVEIYGKSPSGTATQVGGIKMGWYNATGGIEVLRGGGSYGVGLAFNVSPDISGGTTFEAMRIMLNGNVGIGTTTPATTLHVQNPLAATTSANANARVLRLSRPTTPGLKWDNIAQFNLGSYSTAIAANSRLDLALTDGGNATDLTNVMTWQANGNVGVGTTSPASKLEVNGAATNNTSINTSNTTIDYSLSNLAATSNTATSITLSNIKNGGAYTLAFTSTAASGTVAFTATGFTFVYIGTVARTAGKKHIYNFVVIGTEVFVTMGTEN